MRSNLQRNGTVLHKLDMRKKSLKRWHGATQILTDTEFTQNSPSKSPKIDMDTCLTEFSFPRYGVHAYILGPTFVNITIARRAAYMGYSRQRELLILYQDCRSSLT
uniref:Putative ovule protein n=1 Tax=Solanum chacoense TaxID=4108 RepID=A0A0V0GL50_SOLCH